MWGYTSIIYWILPQPSRILILLQRKNLQTWRTTLLNCHCTWISCTMRAHLDCSYCIVSGSTRLRLYVLFMNPVKRPCWGSYHRNDACIEGGESVVLDSFAVAEEMREKHPQLFATLTRIPITFQRIDNLEKLHYTWMNCVFLTLAILIATIFMFTNCNTPHMLIAAPIFVYQLTCILCIPMCSSLKPRLTLLDYNLKHSFQAFLLIFIQICSITVQCMRTGLDSDSLLSNISVILFLLLSLLSAYRGLYAYQRPHISVDKASNVNIKLS